jgi:GMP synthase (glutamine-hydrolysing)
VVKEALLLMQSEAALNSRRAFNVYEEARVKQVCVIKHVVQEGPGTLGDYFKKTNVGYSIFDVAEDGGACLSVLDLSRTRGLVVLGGPMNVYETDKYPFLDIERWLIREAVKCRIPVLGVCLGAQLMATAFGASVQRAPVRELGWYRLELSAAASSDPLMKHFDSGIDVFQWHEDTFDLSPEGILLARGNGLAQAFRVGSSAWGFQFHVEVDRLMIESWCDASGEKNVPAHVRQEMLSGYDRREAVFRNQGERLFKAFTELF